MLELDTNINTQMGLNTQIATVQKKKKTLTVEAETKKRPSMI